MSGDFGSLSVDRTPLEDGGRDDRLDDDLGPDPSEWQQELDYRVVAESSMTVPGRSDPAPSCGEWAPREFCDECGEVHFAPSRCERRSCPDCVGEWTRQRAVGITRRLTAARYAEEDGLDRRAVHAVISAPEGSITTLRDVYDGYSRAYRIAENHGVRGGVAIFHAFRVLDEVKQEFRAEDPDMGIWRWLLTERPESWRSLTYWSPHWHVIGLCRDFAEDSPEDQNGWVARRIRSLEPLTGLSDPEPYEDTVGLVRYLMSHATFEAESSRDCVRWFADLATANFQAEEQLSEGAIDTIDRKAEEAAKSGLEDGEGYSTEDDPDPCPDCGSTSRSRIWDAKAALSDSRWCDSIGREKQKRLLAAFEWRVGDRMPPPGLKRPDTEERAREALSALQS